MTRVESKSPFAPNLAVNFSWRKNDVFDSGYASALSTPDDNEQHVIQYSQKNSLRPDMCAASAENQFVSETGFGYVDPDVGMPLDLSKKTQATFEQGKFAEDRDDVRRIKLERDIPCLHDEPSGAENNVYRRPRDPMSTSPWLPINPAASSSANETAATTKPLDSLQGMVSTLRYKDVDGVTRGTIPDWAFRQAMMRHDGRSGMGCSNDGIELSRKCNENRREMAANGVKHGQDDERDMPVILRSQLDHIAPALSGGGTRPARRPHNGNQPGVVQNESMCEGAHQSNPFSQKRVILPVPHPPIMRPTVLIHHPADGTAHNLPGTNQTKPLMRGQNHTTPPLCVGQTRTQDQYCAGVDPMSKPDQTTPLRYLTLYGQLLSNAEHVPPASTTNMHCVGRHMPTNASTQLAYSSDAIIRPDSISQYQFQPETTTQNRCLNGAGMQPHHATTHNRHTSVRAYETITTATIQKQIQLTGTNQIQQTSGFQMMIPTPSVQSVDHRLTGLKQMAQTTQNQHLTGIVKIEPEQTTHNHELVGFEQMRKNAATTPQHPTNVPHQMYLLPLPTTQNQYIPDRTGRMNQNAAVRNQIINGVHLPMEASAQSPGVPGIRQINQEVNAHQNQRVINGNQIQPRVITARNHGKQCLTNVDQMQPVTSTHDRFLNDHRMKPDEIAAQCQPQYKIEVDDQQPDAATQGSMMRTILSDKVRQQVRNFEENHGYWALLDDHRISPEDKEHHVLRTSQFSRDADPTTTKFNDHSGEEVQKCDRKDMADRTTSRKRRGDVTKTVEATSSRDKVLGMKTSGQPHHFFNGSVHGSNDDPVDDIGIRARDCLIRSGRGVSAEKFYERLLNLDAALANVKDSTRSPDGQSSSWEQHVGLIAAVKSEQVRSKKRKVQRDDCTANAGDSIQRGANDVECTCIQGNNTTQKVSVVQPFVTEADRKKKVSSSSSLLASLWCEEAETASPSTSEHTPAQPLNLIKTRKAAYYNNNDRGWCATLLDDNGKRTVVMTAPGDVQAEWVKIVNQSNPPSSMRLQIEKKFCKNGNRDFKKAPPDARAVPSRSCGDHNDAPDVNRDTLPVTSSSGSHEGTGDAMSMNSCSADHELPSVARDLLSGSPSSEPYSDSPQSASLQVEGETAPTEVNTTERLHSTPEIEKTYQKGKQRSTKRDQQGRKNPTNSRKGKEKRRSKSRHKSSPPPPMPSSKLTSPTALRFNLKEITLPKKKTYQSAFLESIMYRKCFVN